MADDSSGVSAGGGRARAERWKFFTLTIACHEGHRPPMTSSPMAAARCQHLLDLLAQVPDPRKKRGRRHALAGLLAVGIAAVIAGSKSFAAIGQWAGDAGPDVLAALGAERGPAEESTYRRAFALVSADVLDRVLGAWLHTRAVRAGGRLVIAIDGKTVRGAKSKGGRAPHLVAALAHGIGAVLGQVAVDEKSNEIPAVRELLKAFADVAGAVFTIDAMHTQTDTAKVILARRADYVMTVKKNQRAHLVHAAQEASLGRNPRRLLRGQGPRPPGPPHHQGGARAGLDRVRRRRPGRAAAPHRHAEREEDRRGRLPDHQRQRRRPGHPGRLGPEPSEDRKLSSLGEGRDLPGRQIAGQDGKRAPGDGLAEEPGHQPPAPGRPGQHSSGQPSPPPRPTAHAKTASGCMNATLPCPWAHTFHRHIVLSTCARDCWLWHDTGMLRPLDEHPCEPTILPRGFRCFSYSATLPFSCRTVTSGLI